MEHNSLY